MTGIASEDHAVIIYCEYGIKNDQLFYELVDEFLDLMKQHEQIGYYDGHEIAMDNSDGYLYFYGGNAETIFKTIRPVLKSRHFMQNAVACLRFRAIGTGKQIEVYL